MLRRRTGFYVVLMLRIAPYVMFFLLFVRSNTAPAGEENAICAFSSTGFYVVPMLRITSYVMFFLLGKKQHRSRGGLKCD